VYPQGLDGAAMQLIFSAHLAYSLLTGKLETCEHVQGVYIVGGRKERPTFSRGTTTSWDAQQRSNMTRNVGIPSAPSIFASFVSMYSWNAQQQSFHSNIGQGWSDIIMLFLQVYQKGRAILISHMGWSI
jgi:hypothetical protein